MRRDALRATAFMLLSFLLASCGSSGGVAINPPQVTVVWPANGSTVGERVTVSGTTTGDVALVRVRCGNGAFIEASGTETWSVDLDTSSQRDGGATITVEAISPTSERGESSVQVDLRNAAATPSSPATGDPATTPAAPPAAGGAVAAQSAP